MNIDTQYTYSQTKKTHRCVRDDSTFILTGTWALRGDEMVSH